MIKKKVQNAKISNLKARLKGSKVINIYESNKLLHEIENSQISYEEVLKRMENIRSHINKLISMQSLKLNQINVLNTLFMVNEIFTGESESVEVNKEGNFKVFKEKLNKEKQESDEQLDTRDMPELESEESGAERRNQQGQGIKILPITLAQLTAGDDSQKSVNEIRQLLYSLCRSKKLAKAIYNHLINAI